MSEVDLYGIARLLVQEYGDKVTQKVEERIAHYTVSEDCSAIKRWYDIKEAVKEIKRLQKMNRLQSVAKQERNSELLQAAN